MVTFNINQITDLINGGDKVKQDPGMSNQGMPNSQSAPFAGQAPYNMQEMNDLMNYRVAYPEIYYKCQPFVMMACDQMDAVSSEMPTQEMIEMMADNIYDDICRMYPDMVEYIRSAEQKGGANIPAQGFITFDRDRDRSRFRRRGVFRDFIEFLLLSELFRRRRRIF
jgi:FMN phosphatase YigB (HAD superfamily)